MRGFYLLLFLALVVNATALAQTPDDYRSVTSGPWDQAATWERFDGADWVPAASPPNASAQLISISALTVVDINTSVTADQIFVEGDATLNVNNGGTLTIAQGTGVDLDISIGDLITTADGFAFVNAGGLVINQGETSSSNLNLTITGTWRHARNTGAVPAATWNDGSLLDVTTITSTTTLGGLGGQSFYDVNWSTALTGAMNLANTLNTIRRDFTINNTGTGTLSQIILSLPGAGGGGLTVGRNLTLNGTSQLTPASTAASGGYVLNVGGDLILNSTRTNVMIGTSTGQVGINVNGNLVKSSTGGMSLVNAGASPNNGVCTLDVNGNVTWGGTGNLTFVAGSNASNQLIGTFNIGGDLAFTGTGTFLTATSSSNSGGAIVFNDSHTHALSSASVAGPIAGAISVTIQTSNRLNVASNTTISGSGNFSLQAGATLGVSHVEGLTTGSSNGQIRNTGGRVYTAGGNIVYNGTQAQALGNEWGQFGALNNVAVNLEINNSAGVINNITPNATLVGRLTLTSGALDIGAGNPLTIQGDFVRTGGTITGHDDSILNLSGAGTFTGTLAFTPGGQILQSMTISRPTDVILGSNLTIHSTPTFSFLAFQGLGNLQLNGFVLTVNGDITQTADGAIASTNPGSSLTIGGTGALTALPICGSCSNEFTNVTLSRGSGVYTWDAAATIHGTFTLATGQLTHNGGLIMDTNSTFQRGGGTTFTAVGTLGATSTYNVMYTGALTTGAEMPTVAQNRLNNLTVAASGTVQLDKSIRINGNLAINSGTLNANTRTVTVAGAGFAVNGGVFTIQSTGSVVFARAGTTTMSGSTIDGSTFGNMTINSGATVSAPNANINVSGIWTNNGTFTPNLGMVTFSGGTQSINANGQPFYDLTLTGGTKTLTGNLDVNGDLTIDATTLAASSFTINIADEWVNEGTFTAGTSTVVFDGTSAQTITNNGQSFNNLTIASTGAKTLGSALDVGGTLTINSGASLDVSTNDYNLNLGGNWANNGTFNPRVGTVTLNGGGPQAIGGSTNTQFYNITQTNSSTVTISSTQSLVNALTLSAGIFNPNGNFVMLSSADGDARINPLTGGASIAAANMTIQRYLPNNAGVQQWRYLAAPVTNAVAAGWKDDFPITGPWTDHSVQSDFPSGPTIVNPTAPSMYIYNESHTPTTTVNDRYEVFPPAAATLAGTALTNGRGYSAFVRQVAPITIELVGRAATGPVPVTVTDQAAAFNDGWNLIGNPYPAPINWENVDVPVGVNAQIAMLDNTNTVGLGTGTYIYYTKGVGGIPASYHGTIAQGQAFWVRKMTAGATDIIFQEDDKEAVRTPAVIRETEENILRMHVAGRGKQDELVITFRDDAADEAEEKYDAFKLANESGTNLYSLSKDQREMAINTFGSLACSREIPVVLNTLPADKGDYAFTFSQIESFAPNVDIRLLDAFTGDTFVVTEDEKVYGFVISDDEASFDPDRFKVYIGYEELDLDLGVQAEDACTGGDAHVTVASAQPGVTYHATLNGTAVSDKVVAQSGNLTLSIPTAKLANGANTLVIKAQSGTCAELPLAQSATVRVESLPSVSNVTAASACGENSVMLSAQGAPTDGSYRWYLTEDATDAIEGETASSLTTPVLGKTTTYFVAAVNALGCESARMPVTATIGYLDDATITVEGDLLVSSSETGNQWYLDGAEINGATAKTYKPTESGTYKLVVTSGPCTSEVEREYAVTGDITGDDLKGYLLYPNPSAGVIYIEVQTTNEVGVSILNGVGKEVIRGELKQEGARRKGEFDISGSAAGVYLVVIKHGQQTVTRKIVKN